MTYETDALGRRIIQHFGIDWEKDGGELVIINEGTQSRIAAGELTEQLIAGIAAPHLDDEIRNIVALVTKTFGAVRGISVVELPNAAKE